MYVIQMIAVKLITGSVLYWTLHNSIPQTVPFHLMYAVIWTQMVEGRQYSKDDGSVYFFLRWDDYERRFGSADGEYCMGHIDKFTA